MERYESTGRGNGFGEDHGYAGDGAYDRERGTGELVKELIAHAQNLVREEVRLARVELRDEAKKAARGSALTGAGAVVAYVGMLALTACLILALATAMAAWLAALIVGGVLLIIGGAIVATGVGKLRDLGMNETRKTLEEDGRWAKETMREIRSSNRANA